ncbi:MAG: hypothetical protein R2932_41255 [Caldilineaceae bacterium]
MSVMTSGTMESPLMGNALAEIAVLFQREWQRLHQDVVSEPLTTLRAGLLTVALPNVLSTDECARTTNASGRQQITQRLERWIDLAYPRLATQIELLLRCYVTSTQIDIADDSCTVNVQFGLRYLPRTL